MTLRGIDFGSDPHLAPRSPWRDHLLTLWLLGFLFLLYIPFTGNYGLWDPWETHYGEVAHQMVERQDWISLWWPGSPLDPASGVFWSKEALTFWIMALSMMGFGLGHPGAAHAAEMTQGWRAEWALRLPFVLISIAGVWAVWHLVRRLAGTRPALLAAAVLATCTQWALITRQAVTDMAFVTPMNVALAFAGLSLLLPKEEMEAELPRREVVLGDLRLSWPHARAFYVIFGLYLLCTVPQLVVDCVQLKIITFVFAGRGYRSYGIVAMLPWLVLFVVSIVWMMRVRDRRSMYLWVAYIMGGLGTLAKGPAGMAMPAIILFLYLLVSGRMSEFLGRRLKQPGRLSRVLPRPLRFLGEYEGGLEVVRGSLIFLCVAGPWFAAMLARHGVPFWMEIIGDNYVNRARGRHGDRGTFEYYLRQLGAGLFPWSGVIAAAVAVSGRWLREEKNTARRHLVLLALVWFLADFMVVALVNTKFHHYILPALPALAILCGLFLDELCSWARTAARDSVAALFLLGLPITWLSGRDLSAFPARIGWLFNYDYVNVPGSGRPWPLTSLYGQRYEYGTQVMIFAVLAVVLTGLLCVLAGRALGPAADPENTAPEKPVPPLALQLGGIVFLGLLLAGCLIAPSPDTVAFWSSSKLPVNTVLPAWMRLGWLVPAAAAGLWLLASIWLWRPLLPMSTTGRWTGAAAVLLLLCAVGWNNWVLDRYMIDISPHWSQKSVFATYYRLRHGPSEPVLAWQMYWRGENFYTKNQIYDHRLANEEKTVFLGDHNTEKLQTYLNSHRGRRIFVLLERNRLESLRALLPEAARPSLQVVDESNNKVYLAMAQL